MQDASGNPSRRPRPAGQGAAAGWRGTGHQLQRSVLSHKPRRHRQGRSCTRATSAPLGCTARPPSVPVCGACLWSRACVSWLHCCALVSPAHAGLRLQQEGVQPLLRSSTRGLASLQRPHPCVVCSWQGQTAQVPSALLPCFLMLISAILSGLACGHVPGRHGSPDLPPRQGCSWGMSSGPALGTGFSPIECR